MMREKISGVSEEGEVQRRQRVTQPFFERQTPNFVWKFIQRGAQFFRGTVQIDQNWMEGQRLT